MSSAPENRRQLYERLVGQTVAERYDIIDLLGYGGMGAVYEAVQRNMDRRVALKYIPAHDPVMAARFEREAKTVSKLSHPNTVTVFDYGQTDDGFLFLSMELLSGRTLTDLVEDESPLAPRRVVHIASQICRSLAEAHELGVVHRDIKPDNVILISVDGDPDVPKVLDFGIAKAVGQDDHQQTLTGDGRIVGTPRYMSPEQILSEEIDHRSDIYSLGCIVFEMLCGMPPFRSSSTTELMLSHAQEPAPPFAECLDANSLSGVPDGIEHVVRRCMAKSPADRPQSTDEMRAELQEALEAHQANRPARVTHAPEPSQSAESPVPADRSSPVGASDSGDSIVPPSSRPFIFGGIAVVVAAVMSAVAVVLLLTDSDDEPSEPLPAVAQQDPVPDGDTESSADEETDEDDRAPRSVTVSDTIHIRLESDPDGADVVEDGETVGSTPYNLSVSDVVGPLIYELSADDHRSKEVTLDIDPDGPDEQVFSFELEPERPARAQRSGSRSGSSGAGTSGSSSGDDATGDDDTDDTPLIPLLDDSDEDDDDDDGPNVPTL